MVTKTFKQVQYFRNWTRLVEVLCQIAFDLAIVWINFPKPNYFSSAIRLCRGNWWNLGQDTEGHFENFYTGVKEIILPTLSEFSACVSKTIFWLKLVFQNAAKVLQIKP